MKSFNIILAGAFLTLPFYYLINYKSINDYKKQIENCGHKLEENEVTTEDGYILNLWHLVPNFDVSPDKVIFFQNGFAATGRGYFMLEEQSLPYLLYEKGYDIWIGNNRGTKVSQNHVSKNSKKVNSDYWDFSMDDFVKYDIQSQINYIKKRTNAKKVDFVGYSEGTTLFLMLYMDYPEFVESSINRFISFGLIQSLPSVSPIIDNLIDLLYNLFQVTKSFSKALQVKDSVRASFVHSVKKNIISTKETFIENGFITNKTESENLINFFKLYPTDISIYNIYQWQAIQDKKALVHFNPRLGGENQFEEYDKEVLKKWKIKAFITRSETDNFSLYKDVTEFYNNIENKSLITLFDCDYSHLDFALAKSAYRDIYLPLMKYLEEN